MQGNRRDPAVAGSLRGDARIVKQSGTDQRGHLLAQRHAPLQQLGDRPIETMEHRVAGHKIATDAVQRGGIVQRLKHGNRLRVGRWRRTPTWRGIAPYREGRPVHALRCRHSVIVVFIGCIPAPGNHRVTRTARDLPIFSVAGFRMC